MAISRASIPKEMTVPPPKAVKNPALAAKRPNKVKTLPTPSMAPPAQGGVPPGMPYGKGGKVKGRKGY